MIAYRARNLRTHAICNPGDESQFTPDDEMEWILEYEIAEATWEPSGFHIRDIMGVQNPKTFAEVVEQFLPTTSTPVSGSLKLA